MISIGSPGKRWIVLLIAMSMSTSYAAHAQTNTLESREREAKQAYTRGDLERARQLFAELHEASPKPKYLWNLAIVENRSGHFIEALRRFKEYLRSPDASDKDRDTARAYLQELTTKTGHIAVEARAGTRLVVDDVDTGKETPLEEPLDVEPGRHSVEGRLAGKRASAVVQADAGQVANVTLVLDPPAERVPIGPMIPMLAPRVETRASATGLPVPDTPQDRALSHSTAKIVTVTTLGVAALASFGARIAFGIAKSNAEDNLDALRAANGSFGCSGNAPPASCAQMKDEVDRVNRNTTLANVFLGTGIGLAIATGVTWFVWPKTARRGDARMGDWRWAPVVAPGGGGLSNTVDF